MIYQGASWPAAYDGSIFMNNIHGARINRDVLKETGSGFVGSHGYDFLLANDLWSQIISLKYGPDGSLFMIDWYDKNQCHHTDVNGHDRTNGRIFKVSYGAGKPFRQDLHKWSSHALVQAQTFANEWYARHARRILQERGPSADAAAMVRALDATTISQPAVRLRLLLTQYAVGGLSDRAEIERRLADPDATIRAWTIQLATEQGSPVLARFAQMARSDPSPRVRLYLAAALQRLPLEERFEIIGPLLSHAEDATDANLPLMEWYAVEPLAALDAPRAARLAADARLPRIQEFMARRIGAIGTAESVALLVDELARARTSEQRAALLLGMDEGLLGRRQVAMPAAWPGVFAALAADRDAHVRSLAVASGVTFGDAGAGRVAQAARRLERRSCRRRDALAVLLRVKDPALPSLLQALVIDRWLGSPAIRGLAAYDDPATPEVLVGAYRSLGVSERRERARRAGRAAELGARLLGAVEAGKLRAVT